MTKDTQPTLSRPKEEVIVRALVRAAHSAANLALDALYMARNSPCSAGQWETKAKEALRDLSDYAALTPFPAEPYLRDEAERKNSAGFRTIVDQALAMLASDQ